MQVDHIVILLFSKFPEKRDELRSEIAAGKGNDVIGIVKSVNEVYIFRLGNPVDFGI